MSKDIYTISFPGGKANAIAVSWLTPSGRAKSLNFGCSALELIEAESGLPGGNSSGHIAYQLRIPLPMLTAIQRSLGIDVQRRKRSYSRAIDQAIALTRAQNFPLAGPILGGVPIDIESMMLPDNEPATGKRRRP